MVGDEINAWAHTMDAQHSMEIDDEEEYLKALNASLLIQTPLQVSLELIQKRLRKQANAIEALKHKLKLQDETSIDAKSLLERMQSLERGLLELKSSKLSPFSQAEILTRLDDMAEALKDQKLQLQIHMETVALQRKNDLEKAQKPRDLEINAITQTDDVGAEGNSPLTSPRTEGIIFTIEESEADEERNEQSFKGSIQLDEETKAHRQQWEEFVRRVAEMEFRLSAHETAVKYSLSKLEEQHTMAIEWHQTEFLKFKQQISNKEQVSYSDHETLVSKVEYLENKLQQNEQFTSCQDSELFGKLNEVETKLESLEKNVKVAEQRAETAMSAALSSLESSIEKESFATVASVNDLQDQLKRQPSLSDVKECVREELDRVLSKKDTSLLQNERPVVEAIQPARATKFICLSCDRELDPSRPEPLGDLPSAQGLLPEVEHFKTKSVFSLQPIGPGLNAAELRKLQFIAEKNNNANATSKQSKTTSRDSERQKSRHLKTPLFL